MYQNELLKVTSSVPCDDRVRRTVRRYPEPVVETWILWLYRRGVKRLRNDLDPLAHGNRRGGRAELLRMGGFARFCTTPVAQD